jgi:hypothetical protein
LGLRDLYVTSDSPICSGNSVLLFKGKAYKQDTINGPITNGLDCPIGATLDSQGNLYVANGAGSDPQGCGPGRTDADVQEYAPGATSPTHTWTGGGCLNNTDGYVFVTTDLHGYVYAGTRSQSGAAGAAVIRWIPGDVGPQEVQVGPPEASVYGVAVDRKGDIFADAAAPGAGPTLQECVPKGGTWACSLFPLSISGPGGIALDKAGNLLVADSSGKAVDVIAPPYTSISRTIGSGYSFPLSVSLNKAKTLAFVADPIAGDVFVVNYQTGANVTTIPVSGAVSAVDGPNAVF